FMLALPPRSILPPYTTLFRSARLVDPGADHHPHIVHLYWLSGWLQRLPPVALSSAPQGALHTGCSGHWSQAEMQYTCSISTATPDRKSTRLNSSHVKISYAVF